LVRRLNCVFQFVFILILFGSINYLSLRHFKRIDLTKNHAHTLSAETLAYIENLKAPITVYVTLTDDENGGEFNHAFNDVKSMLREFDYAARNNPENHITVKYLNIFQQRRRAETLGLQHSDVVVFTSGEKKRTVFPDELYRTQNRKLSQFQGEKAFTSALLDVSNLRQKVLYFLTGHGEMRLDNVNPIRGISQLEGYLKIRNFETRTLDLNATGKVPEDADMVFLISPQAALYPTEQEALRRYLASSAGRFMIILDPGIQHGLDDLFFEWGILADDVLVIESDPNYRVSGGDLLVNRFSVNHPVTQVLAENSIPILTGRARSVRIDPGRPLDESLDVEALMMTSDRSWGERNYEGAEEVTYNAGIDLAPPIWLGVVSERKVDSSLGIKIPGGRVIALGTSDFISNNRIESAGNLTFLLNTVNWALDHENLLNIPPRPVEELQLVISQEQLYFTRIAIVAGPPVLIGLFGFFIFLLRRN
jgi:ABC-type uncharacterized transport system involved in gliding motility auxiliary subunit